MQTFRRHDVCLDQAQQRIQHRAGRAHDVGRGRQADRHALPGISLDLAIERLMLTELLEQDHRQQAGRDYRKFRVLGGLEGKKEPYYVTPQSPIDIQ